MNIKTPAPHLQIQSRKHVVRSIMICLQMLLAITTWSQRSEIPLNTDWQYMPGYTKRPAFVRPVTLPHTWNVAEADAGVKNYYRGEGSYERQLFISKANEQKRLFLKFEGVASVAWVFVNGQFVGEHRGGYTTFTFEITDFVEFGEENTLLVKVSNAFEIDVLPLGGDFTKYGGIYRPVSLLVTEKVCISPLDYASSGVYITPTTVSEKMAIVDIATKVSNEAIGNEKVKMVINAFDQQGVLITSSEKSEAVKAGKTHSFTQRIHIDSPHLWQGRVDPYLYRVEVGLFINGKLADKITQPLGLRYFHVDPEEGFFLNGKYLDLFGVNRHQDRAGKGSALSPADHKEDMDLIYEIGANMMRLSHYPHAQEVYDYADSTGLILWSEIPFVGQGGYRNKGYYPMSALHHNGRQQLREMIRQNYNHPSVFFWGLFNELKDLDVSPNSYLKELNALAKQEDAYRLTVAASNLDNSALNQITDLIAWNKYFGWYGGQPSEIGSWTDMMHQKFPKRSIGISEYGAGASVLHHTDTLVAPAPGGKWHPEEWQAYFHEENWRALSNRQYVWGKMIWNMFDFSSSKRNEGDKKGLNDKGLITFDRKTKKDAFYFYKANWNRDPMIHLAEKRHCERVTQPTQIKAYGNFLEAELFINNVSQGKATQELGIFIWPNAKLTVGKNKIEVTASDKSIQLTDNVYWHYYPKANP